VLRLLGRL